jgi:hypothetical protein
MTESTLPHSEKDGDSAIGVDTSGRMNYASGAESGHVEVVLPSLPGSPNGEERLLAKDFGPHVASRIENSLNRQPYMRSGPQQTPAATFRHYLACAKGANLIEPSALKRGETLADEFSAEPEQAAFYSMVVRPWLHSLSPRRRT